MDLLKKVHSGLRHILFIQKWRYLSKKQRRSYDSDFKKDAVRLSTEPGRTVAEVSDALGIRSELLYRWRSAER
ncbi:MAG: transposase, partial [Fibrobacterota bacterium]